MRNEGSVAPPGGEMDSTTIRCAGLLPHPPIVIPAVGRERVRECHATLDACRLLARQLIERAPERLVLISPHAPRRAQGCARYAGRAVSGDLAAFRAPEAAVSLPTDPELDRAWDHAAQQQGLRSGLIEGRALDHGAVVPLWFLCEAGWRGPTTVLSLGSGHGFDPLAWGRLLLRALQAAGGNAALIASGDLSHRVLPEAPAGFHPRAIEFDRELTARVREGRLGDLATIEPELRELAAEDAIEPLLLVGGALGGGDCAATLHSYEHPFGVGYAVAWFEPPPDRSALAALPAIAREALAARLEGRAPRFPAARGEIASRGAVFVTWRTTEGDLRGCIGSLEPCCANLIEETARRACDAGLRDDRFEPVTREELPRLRVEISLLGRLEACDFAALDPRRYGLLVSDAVGRRGVLLPDLPGIDTAAEQQQIACEKAGIAPGVAITLQRFTVQKFMESAR